MSMEEKITIPAGAYTYVVGKANKNLILYSLFGVKVQLPDRDTIVISSDDKYKLRRIKMEILSNIGIMYSTFEHPGLITNFLIYNKDLPFQFKKYKVDIQDKYRIVYTDQKIPQIVKGTEYVNDWDIFSLDKLLHAFERNNGKNYEVTIGRETFYSADKTKEIRDISSKLYYLSDFRSISVGYGKDIKIKWDPVVTVGQANYLMNKITYDIMEEYTKSGAIIINKITGLRLHCEVHVVNDVPDITTFKSKVEKPISETIVLSRLDAFPDIRYKYTTLSTKSDNISGEDIAFRDDNTMYVTNRNNYHLSYTYINKVIKYKTDGIVVKFIHNILDNTYVIKFSAISITPIEIMYYINELFGIK